MSSTLHAITFDAAGTLFAVREPVGKTYGRFARAEGFAVEDRILDKAFGAAVRQAPALAAPRALSSGKRKDWVRHWWRQVVEHCLTEAADMREGTLAGEDRFERFFDAAFSHYGDANAWRLFDDAVATVGEARQRGLRVGILSNFDDRLHTVLDGLGLGDSFDAVIVSTEVGVAKPDLEIFEHTRARLGDAPAARHLHVGDSLSLDAQGAIDAGWRAAWLDRGQAKQPPAEVLRPKALGELFALLDRQ